LSFSLIFLFIYPFLFFILIYLNGEDGFWRGVIKKNEEKGTENKKKKKKKQCEFFSCA